MNLKYSTDMQTHSLSRRKLILISAGLVLLVLVAFEPVRHNQFLTYDDNTYITENIHIRSGLTWSSVKWAFTCGYASNWHPLTWLSHMVDIELFGLDPVGHHLHNLFLHTVSTILLFWLLYKMTGAVWCSAFVAMVFGIHPLHVESVAWAAERKDVLCGLFWMLTIGAYLYYSEQGGVLRYLLVMLCFVLSLMAKPMSVTLPIVFLLLDFWPLRRIHKNIISLVLEKIPLLILVLISCVITYNVQQSGGSISLKFSPAERFLNALGDYASYLGKMLWPTNLAVFYPQQFKPDGPQWPIRHLFLAFLILTGISGLAAARYRKQPCLLVGWLWYLIALIPVVGIVQVGMQLIADRYTYLPSIGIAIMVSWAIQDLTKKWPYQKIVLGAVFGLLAVAMTLVTRIQTSYWKNGIALYEHTLTVTQNNYVIHTNLGNDFMVEGRLDEAEEQFRKALQIAPGFHHANSSMGTLLFKRGQYEEAVRYLRYALQITPDKSSYCRNIMLSLLKLERFDEAAEYLARYLQLETSDADLNTEMADILIRTHELNAALEYLQKAARTNPDKAFVAFRIGAVLQMQNKIDEAIKAYEQVTQLEPDYAAAYNNLGILNSQKGLPDKAEDSFLQSLRCDPNQAYPHVHLAGLLRTEGKREQAIAHYRDALQIRPDDPKVYWELASVLIETDRYSEAINSYHRLLQLMPDYLPAINNLAWYLATRPDSKLRNPAEAISLAERGCELTNMNHFGLLDTLAAAYASGGQFNEAVETAQKAVDLANLAGQKDFADKVSKRLQLYKTGKPYYES